MGMEANHLQHEKSVTADTAKTINDYETIIESVERTMESLDDEMIKADVTMRITGCKTKEVKLWNGNRNLVTETIDKTGMRSSAEFYETLLGNARASQQLYEVCEES